MNNRTPQLREIRNTHPEVFNDTTIRGMDTLEGATQLLQLALESEDEGLLNFVVNNLTVDNGINNDERVRGNEDDAESLEALDYIYDAALLRGDVSLIAAMLGAGNSTTSPLYNEFIDNATIYDDLNEGPLEAVLVLTSDEVIDAIHPSLYPIYGDSFANLPANEYTPYHIKAVERLYSNLGYIPQELKDSAIGEFDEEMDIEDVIEDAYLYAPDLVEMLEGYYDTLGDLPENVRKEVALRMTSMTDAEFLEFIRRFNSIRTR